MQAIILAAGMGRRLGELTGNNTKCMLEVNGIRLIDRMLDSLLACGIDRTIIVVGYKGENVREYVGDRWKGMDIEYVENPDYAATNNIWSLYLAKDWLAGDDTLLLESDLIFEPAVLSRLLGNGSPNVALVDKYESWMDGTVVTVREDGSIGRFISRPQFRYSEKDGYYKTVNIYKFSKKFSCDYYVPFLTAYCHALGRNAYYEQVLKVLTLIDDVPLKALPLEGEKWYEIDDIQDLDIASGIFAPTAEEKYDMIAGRFGGYWRYPHLKDFCYLVNPYFPPRRMLDEMRSSYDVLVSDYPSSMRVNSLLAAKNFSVKEEFVAVGNGAAELIKCLVENHSRKLGVIYPTFEEYPNRAVRESLVTYFPSAPDFRYDADDLIAHFDGSGIDTLVLINPDNPSGNCIGREGLLKLVRWSGGRGIMLVVDESFSDFSDCSASEIPLTLLDNALLADNPHLKVVKSISKSYGVPGLRLGIIASGDRGFIRSLKKETAIWNINSFAEFFMQIFEKYEKDYHEACRLFREERRRFRAALETVPFLRVIPSQANYFLCEVTGGLSSRELAVRLLSDHGILVKDCSSKKGIMGNYIRVAVRDSLDNDLIVEALKKF